MPKNLPDNKNRYHGGDMQAYEKNWVRLPLEGTVNTRELGGYPTPDGGQTAYHRFLRADRLNALTDADVEFLRGYGVTLVVDLRSEGEAAEAVDRDLGEGVDHFSRCLVNFDASVVEDLKKIMASGDLTPAHTYIQMLDNTEAVAEIFHAMATARPGCVLFHCNAGKDRTGMVAALLLMLAGVDRMDVCTNYAQTRENLLRIDWYRDELGRARGIERTMVGSDPETIGTVYDHIVEKYGSAEGYLLSCGVSAADIAALRGRLIG